MKLKLIVFVIVRLTLTVWLVFDIFKQMEINNLAITASSFINDGLLTFMTIDSYGNEAYDFLKIISILGFFLLSYVSTLMLCAELSEGARLLFKYHAKHKLKYYYSIYKYIISCYLKELFLFVSVIMLLICFKGLDITTEFFFSIMRLAIFQIVSVCFVFCISPNSLVYFVLFILLIIVQSLVVTQSIVYILIVVCLISMYIYLFVVERGEE